MSNKCSRTIVLTHSQTGLSITYWRWFPGVTGLGENGNKVYKPRRAVNLATIDAIIAKNPPSMTRFHLTDNGLIVTFHYGTFYHDETRRKRDKARLRWDASAMKTPLMNEGVK